MSTYIDSNDNISQNSKRSSSANDNNISIIKDKSPEMPAPIRTIPQPILFTSHSCSLPHKQNSSKKINTKGKSKNNKINMPCKSSTQSTRTSQNVYKENATKVKAHHGLS